MAVQQSVGGGYPQSLHVGGRSVHVRSHPCQDQRRRWERRTHHPPMAQAGLPSSRQHFADSERSALLLTVLSPRINGSSSKYEEGIWRYPSPPHSSLTRLGRICLSPILRGHPIGLSGGAYGPRLILIGVEVETCIASNTLHRERSHHVASVSKRWVLRPWRRIVPWGLRLLASPGTPTTCDMLANLCCISSYPCLRRKHFGPTAAGCTIVASSYPVGYAPAAA